MHGVQFYLHGMQAIVIIMDSARLSIGKRIKAARLMVSPRMSRARLGELLGVDDITIYRWETGRSPVSNDIIERIAFFLGVTFESLVAKSDGSPTIDQLLKVIKDQEARLKQKPQIIPSLVALLSDMPASRQQKLLTRFEDYLKQEPANEKNKASRK